MGNFLGAENGAKSAVIEDTADVEVGASVIAGYPRATAEVLLGKPLVNRIICFIQKLAGSSGLNPVRPDIFSIGSVSAKSEKIFAGWQSCSFPIA